MEVSEERILELIEEVLSNPDDDYWCVIPDGLTDDEEEAVKNRLLELAMAGKLHTRIEGALEAFGFISDVEELINGDDLGDMERVKLMSALDTINTDAKNLLMDLHSPNVLDDFFQIELIQTDESTHEDFMIRTKLYMLNFKDTVLKEELDLMIRYCKKLVEITGRVMEEAK